MSEMVRRRVAVVGTGFGAFGALRALSASPGLDIFVFDIGLTDPVPGQPDRAVANAKTFKSSFFTYGVNDDRWNVKLASERLCSSHALGGHSTVYSGAVLAPKDSDLHGWPAESRPREEDYRSILAALSVLHSPDRLDSLFPLYPTDIDLAAVPPVNSDIAVLGLSRLLVEVDASISQGGFSKAVLDTSPPALKPLQLAGIIKQMLRHEAIKYRGNCYVTQLRSDANGVAVRFEMDNCYHEERFDAVFVGAGCINTTGVIDRSLFREGRRTYQIKMPSASIQAFIRMAFSLPQSSLLRRRNGLPEFFLEINSPLTHGSWSHTQITVLNDQIVSAVCAKLPSMLHPIVRMLSNRFYFALSGMHSDYGKECSLECRSELDASGDPRYSMSITELQSERNLRLSRAAKRGVLRNWKALKLIPFPFGETLSDFFKGNRLGGWHFGSTIPMTEHSGSQGKCDPSGMVNGLKDVYIVDAAAFPSVPASTIALLTAAHGHRVARHWLSKTTSEQG